MLWLGTRLTALGYDVWTDILKLRGGQDWTEALEQALKEKAAKTLLVCTPGGLAKKGVQREIKLAQQVAKKIGDEAFIIPLRKEKYELTFDTALAQYIDFSINWGEGLTELAATLEEYEVPRLKSETRAIADSWRALVDSERSIVENAAEPLVSNALPITQMPDKVGIYHFAYAGRDVIESAFNKLRLPHARAGDYVIGFCSAADYLTEINRALSFDAQYETSVTDFMQAGFSPIDLAPADARRHLVSLLRQHWDLRCRALGLREFEFAGRSIAWWPTIDRIGDDFISFPSPLGGIGRRQLIGREPLTSLALRSECDSPPRSSSIIHADQPRDFHDRRPDADRGRAQDAPAAAVPLQALVQ